MAIHERARKAGRKLLAHVRRGRRALQGRRADRGNARDEEAARIDECLSEIAAHVRAGRYFESTEYLLGLGPCKGMSREQVDAWALRQGFHLMRQTRVVRDELVVYVVLRPK